MRPVFVGVCDHRLDVTHPGDLLLRPSAAFAVVVVVVNDHVLKAEFGNVVTGKLSDLAGVFVFPLVALSVVEVARRSLRRPPWEVTQTEILISVWVTALGFAAVKLFDPATEAYALTIGGIRWVARTTLGQQATFVPIEVVQDWTDVAVVPILILTYGVASAHRPARVSRHTGSDGALLDQCN